MSRPGFTKKIIGELVNAIGPGQMNTFCNVGDFNNDGFIDFVVCGRYGKMVWLENKGGTGEWEQHLIDEADKLECGGSVIDLNGDGYPDIINGSEGGYDEIYWWENPCKPDVKWKKRLIAKTGHGQFHDTIIGEVKNDGRKYLVFDNQQDGTTVYCVPLPKDPTVSPWPDIEVIAAGKRLPNPWSNRGYQPDEGLAVGDVDNDGKLEVVCGITWYKYVDGKWEEHIFTNEHYITNKIAIGDIDGDGKNEIVLSEGDALIYGKKEGCKLAWFKPKDDVNDLWEEHVIDSGLLDAHTLHLADLCGNGYLDIFAAEIGSADNTTDDYKFRLPRLMVYENDGKGNFPVRYIIDEGTGTHEAQLVDLRNKGVLDIIGKPLHGPEKWKIHAWYNDKNLK